MSRRNRASLGVLCLLSMLTGCSSVPSQELGGLTWEMPSQPSQPSTRDEDFIGNNAGGLSGVILGPTAALIGNNAAGLVGNNAAGFDPAQAQIMGNNGGNFQVLAADKRFAPVAGAQVVAIDDRGEQVSEGPVTADAEGRFRFEHLRPSGPVVFVVATYTLEGRALTLMATSSAPREAAVVDVPLDPATSLVAKKVSTLLGRKALKPEAVRPAELSAMAKDVASLMTDSAVAEAVLLPKEEVSSTFDRIASEHPELQTALANATPEGSVTPVPPPTLPTEGPAPAPRTVDTLAGNGAAGMKDGAGANAQLYYPYGIATDGRGTLYVADYQNHCIRKVTSDGTVTTFAGSGQAGYRDGAGTEAQFDHPRGLAVDATGGVIVVDTGNVRLRRIAPDGTVTTIAGSGEAGFVDGDRATARFADPRGVAVGPDGRIYVADTGNLRIRVVAPDGAVSTLAIVGDGAPAASENGLKGPYGVAVDGLGQVYVADATRNAIEKISATGEVSRFGGAGDWGLEDGAAEMARFKAPVGLSTDTRGNLYVADFFNHSIRKLTPDGTVSTLAGDGSPGATNGDGPGARFYGPYGLAVGADDRLYVADTSNHCIRTIRLP